MISFGDSDSKLHLLLLCTVSIVLFLVSRYNFLFFHSVAELFIIVIASWIFIISWNTRNIVSGFFVLLGITYFNVGIVSIFHMLTFKGMTVFSGSDINTPTQLWVLSRYLESFGIISAIFCSRKTIKFELVLIGSTGITAGLTLMILLFHFFPSCYTEGYFLTRFKIISEYIFIATNLLAVFLIYKNKDHIAFHLLKLLTISFMMSFGASICFSLYKDVYGLLTYFGHSMEMISLYYIYKALIVAGMRDPFSTLLASLKKNEVELRQSRDHLETKVLERTKDLDSFNKSLQLEIEERKKKERELRDSEERMSLLLKSSKISITLFDKDLKPQSLFANEERNLSQFNFLQLLHTSGWRQLERMMKTVLKNQKSVRDDIEFQLRKESLFFDVVIEPSYEENLQISGVIVIALDITEKKKIESLLKKKLQAIESIYTIATSFNYQKETIYEKICQSIAAFLEVPVVSIGKIQNNQVVGYTRFVNGTCEHSDNIVNCALCKIMLSAKTSCQISGNLQKMYSENRCLAIDDIKTYLGIPVLSRSEELTGVICMLDLRERKFSDDQVQLLQIFARYISNEIEKEMFVKELVQSREMALLGQLTSGVAHEVRNPLNAIWAITEALFLDIDGDDTNLIYKEHIHSQVQRLSRLMQDLLDLGKPHVRNDKFSLAALSKETVRLWTQNNAGRSHTIEFQCDDDKNPFFVQGDSIKIQQVLMNLIDNASEHSPAGSVIYVKIVESEAHHLNLVISDFGSGIPPEIINRIFEPFFTTRKGGTGLGLSIVRRIVENHNGTISLYNNDPPPGVTAKICLPLYEEANNQCNLEEKMSPFATTQNL